MISLWLTVALAQVTVREARTETLAYPEDYGAHVALARAAEAEGDLELALEAWTRAGELSGGNLETALGRAPVAVALSEHAIGLADADTVIALAPQSARGWLLRGWALRNGPGAFRFRRAASAYRQAVALDPDDPSGHCGLGWMRTTWGDVRGARRSFEAASVLPMGLCGTEGRRELPRTLLSWGSLVGTGSVYANAPLMRAGGGASVSAGLLWDDLVFGQVNARALGLETLDIDGFELDGVQQYELYAQVGVRHGGHGARVLAGAGFLDGLFTGSMPVVSFQAWTTWWLTARGTFAWTSQPDGDTLQGGVDMRLPVHRNLAPILGLNLTRFTADDETTATTEDDLRASGMVGTYVYAGDLTLSAGGRFGTEVRPFRLDESSLFNLADPIAASGWVDGTWQATPALGVYLGYEVLRLRPDDDTQDPYHQHLISAGITLSHRSTL